MRLIDADALECISYTGVPDGYDNTFDSGVLWMLDTVDEIPTVAPVRNGKWKTVMCDDGYGEYTLFECDQCGSQSAQKRNYCSNCGAKMNGD